MVFCCVDSLTDILINVIVPALKQTFYALNLDYSCIDSYIHLNLHFGAHWDCSFAYPQHKFWLRNNKVNF